MKKLVVFYIVIFLLIFSGCQSKTGNFSSDPLQTSKLATVTSNIGKTLNDLQRQNPSYEFLHLDGYDFSAECLGAKDGKSAYVFFGTQAGPSLKEMAPKYSKQLKCAGIYTSVDTVFSFISDKPVSIEDFFSSINIDIKDSKKVSFWGGWILFDYMNYSVAIDTGDTGNADSDIYDMPTVKIEKNFPLIIIDDALLSYNEKLCGQYADKNS